MICRLVSPELRQTLHQPVLEDNYLPIDDESDSTSVSDTASLFKSSNDEADTAGSDTDLDNRLEEVNSNTDDDDDPYEDEI